jgi:hypothetical protein
MEGTIMKKTNLLWGSVLASTLVFGAWAQAPVANINGTKHPNLARAQQHIVEAYRWAEEARKENKDELGGHAEKAKQLLEQADQELKQAAEFADHRK